MSDRNLFKLQHNKFKKNYVIYFESYIKIFINMYLKIVDEHIDMVT